MDLGAVGFVVGALPGAVLFYRASVPMLQSHRQVEQIAVAEGKAFSVHFGYSEKFKFMFRPELLLDEEDSAELKAAKLRFLAGRDRFIRGQLIAGAVLLLGALIGAIGGTALSAMLTR